ncbi:hypothetical protein BCR41DRAFT_364687 [Lobosporangium transversale]|uniref:Protein kinase domain-containing protein n=1 Tax=Lobosporangium transversale TaxID=64571 RepID=A0A1Y2GA33_9FUNG|nr:hypothetical protein BCR41DRAFT_364687 [Lobosporangium transversale]ORY97029.1 hypothetical protein BCR41DRAFT_364687 [Lobosporangium transversale]|eukprot:XP_021875575.1 hypothetical protein BCR41DRAFT_364687 [Lobosporangium transversale]
MFLFARRRRERRSREENAHGIPPAGHTEYSSAHGSGSNLPPLAPIGPIDLERGEDKNQPGAPTNTNAHPSVPSAGGAFPGPSGSGASPNGDRNNIGGIAAGVVAGGIIGAAASRRSSEDSREKVSNGHVAPGGPSGDKPTETSSGRGGFVPVPVPVSGGPNDDNSSKNPSGPSGGFVPVPGGPCDDDSNNNPSGPSGVVPAPDNSTTETTTNNSGGGLKGTLWSVAGAASAAIFGKKKNDNDESTTVTSKTTVTTNKHGPVYTTTGTGGRTVTTERTETGTPRHVLTGVAPDCTTVRTITQRTESGEDILIPVDGQEGEEREVITERDENGKIRYIIGSVIGVAGASVVRHVIKSHNSDDGESTRIIPGGTTTITSSTRIVTEHTETGEIRYVIVGDFSGNAIRVITERTSNGEIRMTPTNEPTGELRHVITERTNTGSTRYIVGSIIAGGVAGTVVERTHSGSTRVIPGTISTVTSTTRIITERTSTGEIRYIIVGGFSGNAIRIITERTSTGELRMIPTNDESADIYEVINERTESGEIRYVVGNIINTTITRVIMGPRIMTERTSTNEIRYVIVDPYNGNAIRTKFERNQETGEFVHIPVKEPEGELRYVNEERTETGEIRKVIGAVITGNVTTNTRTVSGNPIPVGSSTSTQTRIVAERDETGETRYYQITNGPDGQEIRTVVERTEDGSFRIPGGAVIVGAGATLIGNEHQTTTTTRVVGGGTLTPAEQAANKTQITLKLSIMRYERADASAAIPNAEIGTVLFSKFKKVAAGDVNIDDTQYTHVEEVKAPHARRTIKWMKVETHWKREAGMLQHLKSDRYIADLHTLYSLPAFAEYRYVSILGSFSRTLESYMLTEQLSSTQIRQLTASLSDALRWCHEHHVVHLNVRPASFYIEGVPGKDAVNGNGQLVWKLWNFGHARFVGETVDTSVTTATYAAPEILNGRKKGDGNVSSAVTMDRWSLGLIIYELHARKAYFSSSNFAEFQLTNEDGNKFTPALDAIKEDDARKAVRGLLEVEPDHRYTHEILRDVYFGRV